MNRLLLLIALLLSAGIVQAEPTISLPLDGYFRPGKFFPVRVSADQAVDVRIDVAGGIGARGRGVSLTLPIMLLSPSERTIRVSIDGKSSDVPVRALEGNQQLVLTTIPTTVGPPFMLDASRQPVVVAIGSDELGTINEAYESADVVLAGIADLPKFTDAVLRKLLASGVSVATNSPEVSASAWKWRHVGGWSVIDLPVRGPVTSMNDPAAYDAVADFVVSRPLAVRRMVFLGAVMFSIVALASTLLGRRAIYATCVVCFVGLIAGLTFAARQPSIDERTAVVFVPGTLMDQRDEWSFRTSSVLGPGEWKSTGDMDRPIFAGQADDLAMLAEIADGGTVFHYTLRPGQKLAFVRRQFIPPMRENDAAGEFGWMKGEPTSYDGLIRKYYLKPGDGIEVPASKSGNPPSDFLVRVPLKSN